MAKLAALRKRLGGSDVPSLQSTATSPEKIERLRLAVEKIHSCKATWRRSAAVNEAFRGQTIWKGTVEVFGITDHPKARAAYAWIRNPANPGAPDEIIAVLHLPPVNSPASAVRIAYEAANMAALRQQP